MKNSQNQNWTCPRTCRTCEAVDACRFGALLQLTGITATVTSHTMTVKVELSNREAFKRAVESMGGNVGGIGRHTMFDGTKVDGRAFNLPGWKMDLILTDKNGLKFDDYNGRWGNPADVGKLENAYGIAAAEMAAETLGWTCERVGDVLRVFHPSGGYLDVNGESVDAFGFAGVGCHAAASSLADAMGQIETATAKPEYNQRDVDQF